MRDFVETIVMLAEEVLLLFLLIVIPIAISHGLARRRQKIEQSYKDSLLYTDNMRLQKQVTELTAENKNAAAQLREENTRLKSRIAELIAATGQARKEGEAVGEQREAAKLAKEKEDLEKQREALKQLLESSKQSYPWFAGIYADYVEAIDLDTARRLRRKERPALRAADEIAAVTAEKRELADKCKQLEYRLSFLSETLPWLDDFSDLPPLDAYNIAQETEKYAPADELQVMRRWLSADEYARLSPAERDQLALDRYLTRRKSDWEAGRDYERYIGYLYELKGYKVKYTGAREKLADMGRDLIATNGQRTLIIQCKRWNKHKIIHEKHIFQLFGSVTVMRIQHPEEELEAVLVTSCPLSQLARDCAAALHIEIADSYPMRDYPLIKCHNSKRTGEKIYHLPFDQQYDNIAMSSKNNDEYASTVAEAIDKGYRRAYAWHGTQDN